MSDVDENDIKTTSENALLKWQVIILKVLKHKYSVAKEGVVEYHWLSDKEFKELGLEPLSISAQRDAIESMDDILWPNSTIDGYELTIFDVEKISELVESKIAQARDIVEVKIRFKISNDTATMLINGTELNGYGVGTWKGSLVKALFAGSGEANSEDISSEVNGQLLNASQKMIVKTVSQLNSDIAKHAGIKKLLFGQNVVKFDRSRYLINIQK